MAAMPLYGKNPLKIFFSGTGRFPRNLVSTGFPRYRENGKKPGFLKYRLPVGRVPGNSVKMSWTRKNPGNLPNSVCTYIKTGYYIAFIDVYVIIPPVYEVYRGYIVFAFSVCLCVCVFVNFFFRQRFLRNYLT